jgi:hypothetical protein
MKKNPEAPRENPANALESPQARKRLRNIAYLDRTPKERDSLVLKDSTELAKFCYEMLCKFVDALEKAEKTLNNFIEKHEQN